MPKVPSALDSFFIFFLALFSFNCTFLCAVFVCVCVPFLYHCFQLLRNVSVNCWLLNKKIENQNSFFFLSNFILPNSQKCKAENEEIGLGAQHENEVLKRQNEKKNKNESVVMMFDTPIEIECVSHANLLIELQNE